MSFRVVIARFEEESRDELAEELAEELDISPEEADEALSELPFTVARGLSEDDAEELADILEEVGAKVRIVEVASRRRRKRAVEPEPESEDDEEYEEDEEEPSRPAGKRRAKDQTSQRVLIVVGLILMALLIGVVIMASLGDLPSLSCDSGYRGAGANASLSQALNTFAARYARGFQPDDAIAHGTLSSGKRITLRENVGGPSCYVWIGLSPQGSDLDLHLRQGGQLITEDRGQDNFPVVRHCVSGPAALDLEVEMFGGAGDWVVQRYALSVEAGEDPLVQMHKLYSTMFIANAEAVGDVKRVKQMSPGEERVVPLKLDSQWCYAVLAVSQPGADLDLAMENPQGQKIAEDTATDNYPLIRDICPTEPGEYKLRLIMFGGSSAVVYQVFRGKLGGVPGGTGGQPTPLKLDVEPANHEADAGQASPSPDGGPEPAEAGAASDTSAAEPTQPTPPISKNPGKKS